MSIPMVEMRSIVKNYARGSEIVHALRHVDLVLHHHSVVALIGPSGSGKSTLLNLLAGWEKPDSGQIAWEGHTGALPQAWTQIAVVPQKLGLINELTVEENVALPLRLGSPDPAITDDAADGITNLLGDLGLDGFSGRVPLEISVGEQQRTALGRALIASPALILLDEPTGHQDGEWVAVIFEKIRAAASMGACCLVATHNPEVLSFADRVIEIRDGSVHETGSPDPLAPVTASKAEPPMQSPPGSTSRGDDDHAPWRPPGR